MEQKDSEVGKKRKRARAGDTLMSSSKRGGHSRGCAGGSKVDHVATLKVAASSVSTARLAAMVSLAPWPSVVGGSV